MGTASDDSLARGWTTRVVGVLGVTLALTPPALFLASTLLQAGPYDARDALIAIYSAMSERPVAVDSGGPIPHTGVNPYGVNTFLEQEVQQSEIERSFQMIKDAGFGWVRQQFPWEEIEPVAKGNFVDPKYHTDTWRKYDNIVDLARLYGLQVVARLDTSPRWSHPGNSWAFTPPDDLKDYGDFVYDVVNRYKGKVSYFQIWNEPNLSVEWGRRSVDPAAYVRMLRVAYLRAKEANPGAVILSAPLAQTLEQSPRAMNDLVYLQEMYEAGAEPYFDILSVQGYGLRSGPMDRRLEPGDVNFSRPVLEREIMVRNGDGRKPVWASEVGWDALPEGFPGPAPYGRVTDRQQALYTTEAFRRAQQEWPWMGAMFLWFFKRADEHERDQPFYYFRLVGPDFTPRSVYFAVRDYISTHRYVYPGTWSADHWAVDRSPGWKAEREAGPQSWRALVASRPGEHLEFLFDGAELSLVVARGPEGGTLRVVVGGPTVGSTADARKVDVQLYAEADERGVVVPVALLNPGVHRVSVTTLPGPPGGKKYELEGYVVRRQPMGWTWSAALLAYVVFGGALLLPWLARRLRRPGTQGAPRTLKQGP